MTGFTSVEKLNNKSNTNKHKIMQKLQNIDTLLISQQKEWGEILTGFEQKNKYAVMDLQGNDLYFVAEEGGSFIGRLFLKALRPFTLSVMNRDGSEVIKIKRPFKLIFHECQVYDSGGMLLGTVKWRFAIFRRKYSILDPQGIEIYNLFGPFFRPWTFRILKDGSEQGKIVKRWSGFLKEGFTDADNFGIQFPGDWNVKLKALFLGAVFLIDFVHFENKN